MPDVLDIESQLGAEFDRQETPRRSLESAIPDLGQEFDRQEQVSQPRFTAPQIGESTTKGGPRLSLPGRFASPLEDLDQGEGPSIGKVARTVGLLGRGLRAGVADVAANKMGLPAENLSVFGRDVTQQGGDILQGRSKAAPLPIDTQIQEAAAEERARGEVPWRSTLAGAATKLTGDIPKFAALGLAGPSVLAQSIAAGGIFGMDEEGNFHPKEAVIMGLLPGVGKMARLGTASIVGKAAASGIKGLENPAVQKVLEEVGHQAALDGYMALTSAPELIQQYQKDPTQAALSLGEIMLQNLGFAVLGAGRFRSGVASDTESWIRGKAKEMADDAVKARVSRDYTGAELKDIFNRVTADDPTATEQEKNLVTFINSQTETKGGKGKGILSKGARVTTSERDVSKIPEFWKKYLPREQAFESVEPLTKGSTGATTPIVESTSVQEKPTGTVPVGKAVEPTESGNSLPSAAGQPATVAVPPETPGAATGPVVAVTGLNDVAKLFLDEGKASVSLAQRRLKLGYAKAVDFINQLEKAGAISPPKGSEPREVYPDKLKDILQPAGPVTPVSVTETTPPVPPADMPTTPTITGLRPAIRLVGGEVVVGDAGKAHTDIIKDNKLKAEDIDQRGFVGPQGQFLDREQAAAVRPLATEREPGRLHSSDLPERKQDEIEAEFDKQEKGSKKALASERLSDLADQLLVEWNSGRIPVGAGITVLQRTHGLPYAQAEAVIAEATKRLNQPRPRPRVSIDLPVKDAKSAKNLADGLNRQNPDLEAKVEMKGKKPFVTVNSDARSQLAAETEVAEPPPETKPQTGEPPPPKKPATTSAPPADVLRSESQIKITAPEGATQIRVTDKQGRKSIQPIADLKKSNSFQGVDVAKTEAGTIDRTGKFKPIKGEVKVEAKTQETKLSIEDKNENELNLSPDERRGAYFAGNIALERLRRALAKEYGPKSNPEAIRMVWPTAEAAPGTGAGTEGAVVDPKLQDVERQAEAIRRVFGVNTILVDSRESGIEFNGLTSPGVPGFIFINVNAPRPYLAVIGHETLHDLAQRDPETFKELMAKIEPLMQDFESYHRRLIGIYTTHGKLPPVEDQAKENLLGDFLGDSFIDPQFWKKLSEKEPRLFERLATSVMDYLRDIWNNLRQFGAYKFFSDVPKAHDIAADALVKFAKRKAQERGSNEIKLSIEPLSETNPESKPLPSYKARSVEELKALLPHVGLPAQAESLIREFLNLPMIDKLPKFQTLITDALDGGWQGSKLQDLVSITRGADPITGVHEILHVVADILPDDIKAELERMRVASLDSMIKEAQEAGKPETVKALTDIRDNPTTGGDDFLSRKYPMSLQSTLYPFSSGEEFFTHSASARFQQKAGSTVEGFWARVKEIISNIISAIKRALKLRPNQKEFLDSILRGDFEPANAEEVAAKERQASLDPNSEEADERPRVATQVLGDKYYVFDRERITPESIEASTSLAKEIFDSVGIPVVAQDSPADDPFPNRKGWIAPAQGRDMTPEGRVLLERLKKEIATKDAAPKTADRLANLINSIRLNTMVVPNTAFAEMDPAVRMELGAIAQSEASYRGAALGALAGYRKDLATTGRNLDIELGRIWSDAFGGDDIRRLLNELNAAKTRGDNLQKALDEALKKVGKGPGKGPGSGGGLGKTLGSGTRGGRKIIDLVQQGKGDAWNVLKELAKLKGWSVPTDEDLQKVKDLVDREESLLTPTPQEIAAAGNDTAKLAQVMDDRRLATLEKRHQIMKQVQLAIARWTRPLNWRRYWATPANNASALNEYAIGNMLLKIGFAVPRLPVHIMGQLLMVHVPSRAIGVALANAEKLKGQGIDYSLWQLSHEALADQSKATVMAWRQSIRAFTGALAGRAETRNVDRLNTGIMLFERMAAKAQEYYDKGDYGRAAAVWIIHLPKFALRFVQSIDNMQGQPTELAEMRHQARQFMREDGRSPAEIESVMSTIFNGMTEKRDRALQDAAEILKASGLTWTHAELLETAWNLVKGRMYQEMRTLGMPSDDFRSRNDYLMKTLAWQLPADTGIGGAIAVGMKAIRSTLQAKGIPTPFLGFGNAIGTGVNYMLMNTPFYGTASWRIPGISKGESPWFATDEDRWQRRVQALMWSMLGSMIVAGVMMGIIKVYLHAPKDKESRAVFDAEGHRVGTAEIRLNDHEFIPLSLVVGPGALLSPYLASAAAWKDASDRQATKQAKMNAEAEKLGLTPGKVPPLDSTDLLAIAGEGAWGVLMGNKALSGMMQSGSEFGVPNVKKTTAAYISPFIVGLPGYQELTRAAGVILDPKLATVGDYLLPLSTSRARAVNVLGDPAGTPNDLQRIVQTMSAGTYPWVVDSDQAKSNPAYAALISSGYRPPAINPNKGYAINGEYRPLTDKELENYTVARGQYLRQELSDLGPDATAKQAAQAFQRANRQALDDVGVEVQARATRGQGQAPVGAGQAAAPSGGGATPRLSAGIRAGSARVPSGRVSTPRGPRVGLRRGPTLGIGRVGRGLSIGRTGIRSRGLLSFGRQRRK